MVKKTKCSIIFAITLFVICSILPGCDMAASELDLSILSKVNLETNEYRIEDQYTNISIVTDAADVVFVASKDSRTSVICNEQKNAKHSVSVKDGTLLIELINTRKWYEYIGIFTETPAVTVYLPQTEYGTLTMKGHTGDVNIPEAFTFQSIDIEETTGNVICNASAAESVTIKTSTGNIQAENISASKIDLSASTGMITASNISCSGDISVKVSTGKTKLANIQCGNLSSTGDTGKISLNNVISSGKFSIERSTGEVEFEDCDATEVFIKTDTGDVEGSFLSDKIFIVETDTGDVDVPKTVTGGKCEITTDTGDIEITIE